MKEKRKEEREVKERNNIFRAVCASPLTNRKKGFKGFYV